MIHFDFTVSDADAENIMDCISHEINRCNETIMDLTEWKKDESVIKSYKSRVYYLINLKSKMLNTRV